jgi:hypothetical protein
LQILNSLHFLVFGCIVFLIVVLRLKVGIIFHYESNIIVFEIGISEAVLAVELNPSGSVCIVENSLDADTARIMCIQLGRRVQQKLSGLVLIFGFIFLVIVFGLALCNSQTFSRRQSQRRSIARGSPSSSEGHTVDKVASIDRNLVSSAESSSSQVLAEKGADAARKSQQAVCEYQDPGEHLHDLVSLLQNLSDLLEMQALEAAATLGVRQLDGIIL